MTKALFLTTKTVDCENHVRAWDSAFPKSTHVTFDHMAIRSDHLLTEAAEDIRPDVIFYLGACKSLGTPLPESLRGLRAFGRTVNLCSDAADRPWHPVLNYYRNHACFDLQVSIDGALDVLVPVDLATLTPVDPGPFQIEPLRDIRCGFSGTVGRWNERSEIIRALAWFGGLTVRRREGVDSYQDHARFLKRCRMLLNISRTGTNNANHIKGRVLEAGWAGCCLLESKGSPIAQWFPPGCWLEYEDPPEAAEIIKTASDDLIVSTAAKLAAEVRRRYTARQIYSEMLDRVAHPLPLSA